MSNTFSKNYSSVTHNGVYVGIVKDTYDPTKVGRLLVWVPELSSDPEDRNGWKILDYCSPFAGMTDSANLKQSVEDFEGTQQSYGFWMIPPDIGTHVLVMFANGRAERGYWIGCLYGRYMNHMVPATARGKNYKDKGKELPAAEYNKNEKVPPNPVKETSTVRPYHREKTKAISSQGLINDKVRGTTSSSARRESPSEVFGISTPGPFNSTKKYRKGGHSFVMDDNEDEEYISLRTRSGAQIRIDETNGIVYAINKKGTSWIQMDEDGNVDIFAAESISMRSQKDINFRADRNINIEAGQNVYVKAAKDTDAGLNIVGEDSGIGGDIFLQALNEEHHTVKNDAFFTVTDGNLNIDVQAGNKKEHVAGTVDELYDSTLTVTTGSNIDIKSSGYIHSESSTDFTISATNALLETSGKLHINGDMLSNGVSHSVSVLTGGLAMGVPGPGPVGSPTPGPAIPTASVSAAGVVKAVDFQTIGANGVSLLTHVHDLSPPPTVAFIPPDSPPSTPSHPVSVSAVSASSATSSQTKPVISKTNVLVGFSDPETQYNRKTQSVTTTVDRFMTFEPCPEHKNKGL